MSILDYGVHWFRRDLRVAGNPALAENWKKSQGKVLGFFCFDPSFLSRPDFSRDRFRFFLDTLHALREELREIGSDLFVLDHGPQNAFALLHETLCAQSIEVPKRVSFNRDYEPFARHRDTAMLSQFREQYRYEVISEPDHVLVEPSEIVRPDKPYQVYTPFRKAWLGAFEHPTVQARVLRQKSGLEYLKAREEGRSPKLFRLTWSDLGHVRSLLPDALDVTRDSVSSSVPLPPAGSLAAFSALKAFAPKIAHYGDKRDFPSVAGTSRLSIYFKNGSLTGAQVIAQLGLESFDKKDAGGRAKYFSELIWREFYYYILFHHPRVEHESFQARFKDLAWENRPDYFEAWMQGRTGFPLVDAGMRELAQTGWMHNRVRMVVASFLTKDLLVDWKWGEKYFMERLLDGDLAPNNGGWQWAASTGCDPQPYFRIFNPVLQSEKFDPQGDYIRRFVPELSKLPSSQIHAPPPTAGYPRPIVVHSEQRAKALSMYG
jgi:deoxyribodipyrimidine photo-lyase